MKDKIILGCIGLILLSINMLEAQNVRIQRRLLRDTVKTGEHFQYVLKVKYPIDTELFFPDSADTQAFAPLILIDRIYAPTSSTDSISTDSVIYKFACFFEEDSVQEIRLPVYVFQKGDTLIADSEPVSIYLEPSMTMPIAPASKSRLTDNFLWRKLPYRLNYPYLIGFILVIGLISGSILLAFGSRFQRTYRLKRLRRQYERFMMEYNRMMRAEKNTAITEHGLSLWKAYLENIKNEPFTTYTSKEIAQIIPNEELSRSLRNIDRAIYGNIFDEKTDEALKVLKSYASDIYDEKIKEIKDAR